MINAIIRSLVLVLFCVAFVAACGGADGDMAEGGMDDQAAMSEESGDHDMSEMDHGSEDGGDMADGANGNDEAEGDGGMTADVEAVTGMGVAADMPDIELVPEEVGLPDYGWKLRWFGANSINQEPGAEITLVAAGGRLAGNSGCNEYTGDYEFDNQANIKVGELASTRKACPDEVMGAEQRYLNALRASTRAEIKKDGLFLYDAAGDWLHFHPEERPESK